MKHLNVKWVPETVAIVSLTIASGSHLESGAELPQNKATGMKNETLVKPNERMPGLFYRGSYI